MNATIQQVEEIVSVLTAEQQQLLKDTIRYGSWGDADYEFLTENGEIETVPMFGYCTNDAKLAGNFSGRKVSAMFRSIYKKLCPEHYNQIGRFISHCNDCGAMAQEICFLSEQATTRLLRSGHENKFNQGGATLPQCNTDIWQQITFQSEYYSTIRAIRFA